MKELIFVILIKNLNVLNTFFKYKAHIILLFCCQNMQYLAIEVYKVKNGPYPVIMNDDFQFGKISTYDLRSGNLRQSKYTNCTFVNVRSGIISIARVIQIVINIKQIRQENDEF